MRSDDDFYVVGNQDELAIVRGDTVHVLKNPVLTECEFLVNHNYSEFVQAPKKRRRISNPGPRIDVSLDLIAQDAEHRERSELPKMASDMTVKELLDLVNQRIEER